MALYYNSFVNLIKIVNISYQVYLQKDVRTRALGRELDSKITKNREVLFTRYVSNNYIKRGEFRSSEIEVNV